MTRPVVLVDDLLRGIRGLEEAIGPRASVVFQARVALGAEGRLLDGARVAILSAKAASAPSVEGVLGRLRDASADLCLIVVGAASDRIVRRLPDLARAGADAAYEFDTPHGLNGLHERIRSRLDCPAPRAALEAVRQSPAQDARLMPIILWCLRNGDQHHEVSEVADYFGWDRKTLYRLSIRAEGVTVGEFLARGRRLQVQELRLMGLSNQRIAARMGLSAGSSVANIVSRAAWKWPRGVTGCPNE